jgi:hypothetical protein
MTTIIASPTRIRYGADLMVQSDTRSPQRHAVQVKRYGSGKYYLYADASLDHERIVEKAIIGAARVCIVFDDDVFRDTLRAAGMPEATIERYLESVSLIDDVFGVGQNPGRA